MFVNLSSLLGHQVQQTSCAFTSGGQSVRLECFIPRVAARVPAIIALHGSGGLRDGWAHQPASLLAGRGFAVFVLHYFERTGTVWAGDQTIRQNFVPWMQAISDAITCAANLPQVDGEHFALLGFSLGGYLALSVAAQDRRVKAVVEYFGGLPQELEKHVAGMPPVLILHGEADPVVPVTEAHRLQRLFDQYRVPYEIKVYPGEGHGFNGPMLLDAGMRTLAFLQKHLG